MLGQPAIYRMEDTCDVENKASACALEKVGSSHEGLLCNYIVHLSGAARFSLVCNHEIRRSRDPAGFMANLAYCDQTADAVVEQRSFRTTWYTPSPTHRFKCSACLANS